MHSKIVLASASPRRQRMFNDFEIEHTLFTASIDETPLPAEQAHVFVKRVAGEKALAAATAYKLNNSRPFVVAADTVVVLDGNIMGKPVDTQDAQRMLRSLSGKTHSVLTGWAAGRLEDNFILEVCETKVTFYPLDVETIKNYVETKEPMDKAGAYGIQEKGSFLIEKIEGSYLNVVGLPMEQVLRALKKLGAIDTIFK